MLLVAIGIGVLFTPLFNVKEIEVKGNYKIKSEQLIKKSKFKIGINTFKLSLEEAGDEIAKLPYVNSVLIERILPAKLRISITECIPVAYVSYQKKFIVLDKNGKALEIKNDIKDTKIPCLSDFNLSEFKLGEKIKIKDEKKLEKTLEITTNLYNNNLIGKVESINSVSDKYYLNLHSGLKIYLGDGSELDSKFVMLVEIIPKVENNAGGTLDASDANKVYYRP